MKQQLNKPPYTPSKWGQEFHSLPHDEALGAGAAGPGKTLVLLMDPLPQIYAEHQRCINPDHPYPLRWGESTGWALHLRRTLPMLKQTMQRAHRIFPRIDPGARWHKDDLTWVFSSGYRFEFGHCRDPHDWEKYFSSEYTALGFDELIQFLQEQYDQIRSRVRSTDPVLREMLKTRAMSNPLMRKDIGDNFTTDENPHWVRERFVDPNPKGRQTLVRRIENEDGTEDTITRIYLPATIKDNPDPVFRKQYRRQLLDMPQHIQQAQLYGNWYFTPGSFYTEWNPNLHICRPFKIPETWPMFRSMDWGFRSPGCVHWWALSDEEVLYCVHELTFQGKVDWEVADMVRFQEKRLGVWDGRSLISGVADTQLWENRGHSGQEMATVFANRGVPWQPADKKSRKLNAQRFVERLKAHDHGTTLPGVVFFDRCKKAIQTIPQIQTDSSDSDCPADGGPDHWHDCLAGETLVTTARGRVRIDRLEPGDRVLSSDGSFWPCTGGRVVRRAMLYRVRFSDGSSLLATGNHPLLCSDGEWRTVDQLDTTCYAVSPWIRQSGQQRFRSLTGSGTTSAGTTFSATVRGCIVSCGPRLMESLLRGVRSITETATAPTTAFPTWSAFPALPTGPTIPDNWPRRGACRRISARPSWLRWLGTSPPRGGNGIGNTQRTAFWRRSITAMRRACNAALISLIGPLPSGRSIAPELVARSGADGAASMTLLGHALPVGASSWQAGMRIGSTVHGDALRVVGVSPERVDNTWCTTVPVMGAFVANGVLVANSVLYAHSYASRGKAGIPKRLQKRHAWWEQSTEQTFSEPRGRGRFGYGW